MSLLLFEQLLVLIIVQVDSFSNLVERLIDLSQEVLDGFWFSGFDLVDWNVSTFVEFLALVDECVYDLVVWSVLVVFWLEVIWV